MKHLGKRTKQRLYQKYGTWALVAGASSGIGEALSCQLAELGFNLLLTARRKSALRNIKEELEIKYKSQVKIIAVDSTNEQGVNAIIASSKGLDIGLLIASAGFGTSGFFIESNLEEEVNMLQLNCASLLSLTHHFAKEFANKGTGGIILLSSIVAFQGVPFSANYAATKAYVQSLAEGLYHELKPLNVDVLAVAPGPVHTGFAKRANLEMGNALKPADVVIPMLKALGKKSTVFPNKLTKLLICGLRTVPRWGKIRIMKKVMKGMTGN